MPITNTISRVFMTKPPSPATTQQMSTRLVSGARHSACQANGRCKNADIKAACLRFLCGMILEWKELPCKSAESAHRSTPSSEVAQGQAGQRVPYFWASAWSPRTRSLLAYTSRVDTDARGRQRRRSFGNPLNGSHAQSVMRLAPTQHGEHK